MEHATDPEVHIKRRGKIRRCDWCSELIEVGEKYAKWLYFDDRRRITVYAHKECLDAWIELSGDIGEVVYSDGSALRGGRQ